MELGSGEILLILIVALLMYGGRLPEVARAIGRSMAELKRGLSETKDAVASELDPGLDAGLDEPERKVQRVTPEALAKEDVSAPPAGDAARHEHPN
jgi:sec-independent protein translocase protein TatA